MKQDNYSSRFYKTIAKFTAGFINATRDNLDAKIDSMLEGLTEVLGLGRAMFFQLSQDQSYMSCTHEHHLPALKPAKPYMQNLSLRKYSWWGKMILNQPHIVIENTSGLGTEATAEKTIFKKNGANAIIAIPSKSKGIINGFLVLESAVISHCNQEDVLSLLQIAVTTIIDTRLKIESEEKLERLNRLQELLLKIASIYINVPQARLNMAIDNSIKEIAQFVDADRCYIFDYNFKEGYTTNTHEWCAQGITPQIGNLQKVPLELLSEWVAHHKKEEAYIIHDVSQLPYDGPNGVRGLLEPQNVKSIMTVPMTDHGNLIGFVGFDSVRTHHIYTDKEKSLLAFFAQMISLVKKKGKTQQELSGNTQFANGNSGQEPSPDKGTPPVQNTDIINTTLETCTTIFPVAVEKGVEIILDTCEPIHRNAVADHNLIGQQLTTLIYESMESPGIKEIVVKTSCKMNQGTNVTYTFWVTGSQTNSFSVDATIIKNPGESSKKEKFHDMRLLLVDDNQKNRVMLQKLFAKWGIHCTACEDGLEAIRLIKISEPFNVMVIDYWMPLINGVNTIKMIHQDPSMEKTKIPAIMLGSPQNIPFTNKEIVSFGIHCQLPKPIDSETIYNCLKGIETKTR